MDAIRLDASVLVFAFVLTTIVGIVVGVAPALGAIRAGATDARLGGSRRTTAGPGRMRRVLVVSEIALALVLLVSSGLLFRSGRSLMAVDAGFDPSQRIALQVVASGHDFDSDAARLQFYARTLESVRNLPGVTSAAFTSLLPLSGETDEYGYEALSLPDLSAENSGSAARYAVSGDYFATMGIPLVRGRLLDATDRPGGPGSLVLSASFARRLYGDRDPIGQQMRFGPSVGRDGAWGTVVGVVGDVRQYSLALAAPDAFYVAAGQWNWTDRVATLIVQATGEPTTLVPALRRAIWEVNPNVPIPRIETMTGYVQASAADRQFVRSAIGLFAAAALLLAAIGLYGVISGSVTERYREIGIRTALGATPASIVGQIVGRAVGLALIGTAIGVAGAAAAT
ncbi:MAG TPA: ABC transporter permease, partial [Gemmatimonadales bacterium]|nr:ABC transporter permease [Gemmatimonadales bacterium]